MCLSRHFRRTGFMEYWIGTAASVQLDVGGPDHLGPFLCICGDECAEVCGRAGEHRVAEVGDPRLHPGIGEARVDLFVELVDDLCGRIPGGTDPLPAGSLV